MRKTTPTTSAATTSPPATPPATTPAIFPESPPLPSLALGVLDVAVVEVAVVLDGLGIAEELSSTVKKVGNMFICRPKVQ